MYFAAAPGLSGLRQQPGLAAGFSGQRRDPTEIIDSAILERLTKKMSGEGLRTSFLFEAYRF